MAEKRKVDAKKLLEAVESGRLSQQAMDGYGLEKPASRQGASRGKKGQRRQPDDLPPGFVLGELTVSKRGSLVLPKSLVERLGLSDEAFVARRTKAGILLKPLSSKS